MPPTDGFDELALMRVQGRVRQVVVDGDQRIETGAHRHRQTLRHAVLRSVSRARALCLAAPTARRSTESAGAGERVRREARRAHAQVVVLAT